MDKTNVKELFAAFPLSELKQTVRQMYKHAMHEESQKKAMYCFIADSHFDLTRDQKDAVLSFIEGRSI